MDKNIHMINQHYKASYFQWQKGMGSFGGWAELVKFEKFISPYMNVIDFGCGGGYLLRNLNCKGKIGIEINDVARESATKLGVKVVKHVEEVPDGWADCIISNHALEHVNDPLNQLIILKSKLKKGGVIIFVTPCESFRVKYVPQDINYHLFTWSPMNLGNLFTEAGYHVLESKSFIHKWPPFYSIVAKIFGKVIFNFICKIYGHIRSSTVQCRIVARAT